MNSAIDIHTHVAPSHLPEWANKHTPQSWHTFSVLSDTVSSAPFEQAQQLFFDALLLDSQTLMYPVNTFDVSLFMIVSVHPINFSRSSNSTVSIHCRAINRFNRLQFGTTFKFATKEEEV